MIDVRRLGAGDNENLTLRLICAVYFALLTVKDGGLAFTRPGKPVQPPPMWLHRGCLDGSVRRLMGSDKVTLWKAQDVLAHLAKAPTVIET